MGDRAQVAIKMGDGSRVYLYAHWGGTGIYDSLQTALRRRQRWTDCEYLARIIFQAIVGDDQRETGFGIGTAQHSDLEHPVPVLDCTNQSITWDNGAYHRDEAYQDCTFEQFSECGPIAKAKSA